MKVKQFNSEGYVKVPEFHPLTYVLLKGRSAERAIKEFKKKHEVKIIAR